MKMVPEIFLSGAPAPAQKKCLVLYTAAYAQYLLLSVGNLKAKSQWCPSAARLKTVLTVLLVLSNTTVFHRQLHGFGRANRTQYKSDVQVQPLVQFDSKTSYNSACKMVSIKVGNELPDLVNSNEVTASTQLHRSQQTKHETCITL